MPIGFWIQSEPCKHINHIPLGHHGLPIKIYQCNTPAPRAPRAPTSEEMLRLVRLRRPVVLEHHDSDNDRRREDYSRWAHSPVLKGTREEGKRLNVQTADSKSQNAPVPFVSPHLSMAVTNVPQKRELPKPTRKAYSVASEVLTLRCSVS